MLIFPAPSMTMTPRYYFKSPFWAKMRAEERQRGRFWSMRKRRALDEKRRGIPVAFSTTPWEFQGPPLERAKTMPSPSAAPAPPLHRQCARNIEPCVMKAAPIASHCRRPGLSPCTGLPSFDTFPPGRAGAARKCWRCALAHAVGVRSRLGGMDWRSAIRCYVKHAL